MHKILHFQSSNSFKIYLPGLWSGSSWWFTFCLLFAKSHFVCLSMLSNQFVIHSKFNLVLNISSLSTGRKQTDIQRSAISLSVTLVGNGQDRIAIWRELSKQRMEIYLCKSKDYNPLNPPCSVGNWQSSFAFTKARFKYQTIYQTCNIPGQFTMNCEFLHL